MTAESEQNLDQQSAPLLLTIQILLPLLQLLLLPPPLLRLALLRPPPPHTLRSGGMEPGRSTHSAESGPKSL